MDDYAHNSDCMTIRMSHQSVTCVIGIASMAYQCHLLLCHVNLCV